MSDGISNEANVVRFIVGNLTNLVCALAWASEDAVKQNILQVKQARALLDAVIERAESKASNLENR